MMSLSHTRFRYAAVLWIVLIPTMIASCTVMPDEISQEALPQLPFEELVRQTSTYQGHTVILGGYVVSVENLKDHSLMVAVQAPLGAGQQPKSKDYSKGRLILIHDGFIDPEVFTKDRQITVGGTLIGSSATERHDYPYRYLRVQVKKIHLWPEPEPVPPDPFWYDDCYPYGYWRWHRHPFCW